MKSFTLSFIVLFSLALQAFTRDIFTYVNYLDFSDIFDPSGTMFGENGRIQALLESTEQGGESGDEETKVIIFTQRLKFKHELINIPKEKVFSIPVPGLKVQVITNFFSVEMKTTYTIKSDNVDKDFSIFDMNFLCVGGLNVQIMDTADCKQKVFEGKLLTEQVLAPFSFETLPALVEWVEVSVANSAIFARTAVAAKKFVQSADILGSALCQSEESCNRPLKALKKFYGDAARSFRPFSEILEEINNDPFAAKSEEGSLMGYTASPEETFKMVSPMIKMLDALETQEENAKNAGWINETSFLEASQGASELMTSNLKASLESERDRIQNELNQRKDIALTSIQQLRDVTDTLTMHLNSVQDATNALRSTAEGKKKRGGCCKLELDGPTLDFTCHAGFVKLIFGNIVPTGIHDNGTCDLATFNGFEKLNTFDNNRNSLQDRINDFRNAFNHQIDSHGHATVDAKNAELKAKMQYFVSQLVTNYEFSQTRFRILVSYCSLQYQFNEAQRRASNISQSIKNIAELQEEFKKAAGSMEVRNEVITKHVQEFRKAVKPFFNRYVSSLAYAHPGFDVRDMSDESIDYVRAFETVNARWIQLLNSGHAARFDPMHFRTIIICRQLKRPSGKARAYSGSMESRGGNLQAHSGVADWNDPESLCDYEDPLFINNLGKTGVASFNYKMAVNSGSDFQISDYFLREKVARASVSFRGLDEAAFPADKVVNVKLEFMAEEAQFNIPPEGSSGDRNTFNLMVKAEHKFSSSFRNVPYGVYPNIPFRSAHYASGDPSKRYIPAKDGDNKDKDLPSNLVNIPYMDGSICGKEQDLELTNSCPSPYGVWTVKLEKTEFAAFKNISQVHLHLLIKALPTAPATNSFTSIRKDAKVEAALLKKLNESKIMLEEDDDADDQPVVGEKDENEEIIEIAISGAIFIAMTIAAGLILLAIYVAIKRKLPSLV